MKQLKKFVLRLLYGPAIPQEGGTDVFARRREDLDLPPGRPMKRVEK